MFLNRYRENLSERAARESHRLRLLKSGCLVEILQRQRDLHKVILLTGHLFRFQIGIGRAVYNLSRAVKSGSMGRAIPSLFSGIPANQSFGMRTNCRTFNDRPVCIFINGKMTHPFGNYSAFTRRNLSSGLNLPASEVIRVLRHRIDILFEKLR